MSSTHLSLSLSTSISSPCPRISPALSICVRQLSGRLPVKLHERTGGCTFQPNITLHSGNSLPCLFPSARPLFLSASYRSSRLVRPAYTFPSLAHTRAAVCLCSGSVSSNSFCTLWCIFRFSHASSRCLSGNSPYELDVYRKGSLARKEALKELFRDYRNLDVHEPSPENRGFSCALALIRLVLKRRPLASI